MLRYQCRIRFGLFFFFFKQKTAYEMRISDWSSDVCSSDLNAAACGWIFLFLHEDRQDVVQFGDELFGHRALVHLNRGEFLFGALVQRAHATNEHFSKIVACTDPHAMNQCEHQSLSPARGCGLEVIRVEANPNGRRARGERGWREVM